MEKIGDYINRFFSKTSKNQNYTMRSDELFAFMEEIMSSREPNGAFVAAGTLFDFGYAKGYRAAMAEMKKGGKA